MRTEDHDSSAIESSTESSQKTMILLIALALFIAGFAVRLVYLHQVSEMPTFEHPVMDERYHIQVSDQVLTGALPDEPYFRAPLYLYLLAALRSIVGDSMYLLRLVHSFVGSLLPALVFLLGIRLFSKRVAITAAGIALVYPTLLYFDASLLITSLMTILTSLLVLVLYACQEKKSLGMFWLGGALLGMTALARPNILLLVPALAIWILTVIRADLGLRRALIRYLVICLACAVVIAPVTVRNYLVSGDFVLISWQGGFNFYLGNNDHANGWSAQAPGIDPSWAGSYQESIAIAEMTEGRDLKPSEISDFWYHLTWTEIQASPSHFLSLLWKKVRLFINGYEIPNNQDIYFVRDYVPIVKPLLLTGPLYFPFGLLAPMAVIGFFLSLRHWRRYLILHLTVLSYVVSLLLFFVCARYRQPVLPILILMGSFGAYQIVQYIRQRKFGTVAALLIAFVVLALESNHDILGLDRNRVNAENHLMLAQVAWEQGDDDIATTECSVALDHDSTFADAYANLAVIEKRRGDLQGAIDHNILAILLDSTIVQPYQNLGLMYINLGRLTSAATVLERGHQLFPVNDHVLYLQGLAYARFGDIERSQQKLEKCLEINPANTNALRLYHELVDPVQR